MINWFENVMIRKRHDWNAREYPQSRSQSDFSRWFISYWWFVDFESIFAIVFLCSIILGTLGAAQQLCANLGYEVVQTVVIIELVDLNGRTKLANSERVVALTKFVDADFEEIAKNSDRVHLPNDPWSAE